MKISTLIENLVNKKGLSAENGLALYIEAGNKKILFDTGQTGLFMKNAKVLGISIEDIDILVLSHGHYDHTGGLYPFLAKNHKALVYAKRELFTPKYSGHNRFTGTIFHIELLGDRLHYVDSIIEIAENVFIMPEISVYDKNDYYFKNMNIKVNNEFVPDRFDDELFLALKEDGKINIVTACSHKGITNICTTTTDFFKLPVGLILGGFHLKDCTIQQYVQIMHYFRILQPESIGVCHCTGIEKYADMYHDCESHVFYNYVGNKVTIR